MISIEHTRDGRIVTLTMNRPERRNALNQALVLELTRVLQSLAQDDFVRVILITGAGKAFSAGADLDALSQMSEASDEDNLKDSLALAELFSTIRSCPKVVIAWVNGHAIAGGSGLATACDLAIAGRSAKFGFTEARIGFVPALVSVLARTRLTELAMRELFLTGTLLSSEEAARIGLITRSVADEHVESTVFELAGQIARNTSPEAIKRTKSLLVEMDGLPFGRAMQHAAEANASARRSSDCAAGVQAFLNKADAPWVSSWDRDHNDPA